MKTENDPKQGICDKAVHGVAAGLVDAGAPLTLIMERMLTFCAAHAVSNGGARMAANTFRSIADEIEAGALMHLEAGNSGPKH